jgi:hypothetical protein
MPSWPIKHCCALLLLLLLLLLCSVHPAAVLSCKQAGLLQSCWSASWLSRRCGCTAHQATLCLLLLLLLLSCKQASLLRSRLSAF